MVPIFRLYKCWFCIFFLCAILVMGGGPALAVPMKAGMVISVNPGAVAESAGAARNLGLRSSIFVGDILKTNHTGSLQVLFDDDSILALAEDSEVTINRFVYKGKGSAVSKTKSAAGASSAESSDSASDIPISSATAASSGSSFQADSSEADVASMSSSAVKPMGVDRADPKPDPYGPDAGGQGSPDPDYGSGGQAALTSGGSGTTDSGTGSTSTPLVGITTSPPVEPPGSSGTTDSGTTGIVSTSSGSGFLGATEGDVASLGSSAGVPHMLTGDGASGDVASLGDLGGVPVIDLSGTTDTTDSGSTPSDPITPVVGGILGMGSLDGDVASLGDVAGTQGEPSLFPGSYDSTTEEASEDGLSVTVDEGTAVFGSGNACNDNCDVASPGGSATVVGKDRASTGLGTMLVITASKGQKSSEISALSIGKGQQVTVSGPGLLKQELSPQSMVQLGAGKSTMTSLNTQKLQGQMSKVASVSASSQLAPEKTTVAALDTGLRAGTDTTANSMAAKTATAEGGGALQKTALDNEIAAPMAKIVGTSSSLDTTSKPLGTVTDGAGDTLKATLTSLEVSSKVDFTNNKMLEYTVTSVVAYTADVAGVEKTSIVETKLATTGSVNLGSDILSKAVVTSEDVIVDGLGKKDSGSLENLLLINDIAKTEIKKPLLPGKKGL